MSKKTFTIIIIALVVILVALGWYFFLRPVVAPTASLPTNTQNNLFPFGQTSGGSKNPVSTDKKPASTTIDLGGSSGAVATLPRLRQISFVPTAGAVAFDTGHGSSTSAITIRYIERATGHIFETPNQSAAVKQISNVTLPKITEALWGRGGDKLLIRYLKDNALIRTFYGKISSSSPETALEGIFLTDGIGNISVEGDKIFYLIENGLNAQGITANIDGTKKVAIFNSTFGDWTANWSAPGTITLFSHPSGLVPGSLYTLNSVTGEYIKVIGDVSGLSGIINSDGTTVVYSGASDRSSIGTAVLNIKTLVSKNLGVTTLADKCVWSKKQKNIIYCAVPRSIPSGTYPDDWYKGKTSFADALWKIDTVSGETNNTVDPELEVGISMDMQNISLDQNENVLLFTNKNDMTVWRYNLNE